MKKQFFIIFILSFFFNKLFAQVQTIKGSIVDIVATYPLVGANIKISGTEPIMGTQSDEKGNFRIEKVPVGRHTLEITFIGYKTQTIPNVLVNTGKQTIVNIKLEESISVLEAVTLTQKSARDIPLNEMAKVSIRSFDLEQTSRFSGGANDISRLVTSFAGVSTPNDSRNDIVVRGNSPIGVLWRLEGLPIGNLNHFATLGTTGGPVSAINTNILSTSDFLTAAFPAEYGNVSSAVFDLKYRSGNKEKHEFGFQWAAISGIEAMVEGPIKKEKSSYLISVRKGLVPEGTSGTTATPIYQDVSFKVDLGAVEIFGLGGISNIDFYGNQVKEDDLFSNPGEDLFSNHKLGQIGVSYLLRLTKNTFLKSVVGYSTNISLTDKFNFKSYSVNSQGVATARNTKRYQAFESIFNDNRATLNTVLNTKINKKTSLKSGIILEQYQMDFDFKDRDNRSATILLDNDNDGIPDSYLTLINVHTTPILLQTFAQMEYKFSDSFSTNYGFHSQYFDYNNSISFEPRIGAKWAFNSSSSLSFGYGNHAQMIPLSVFFFEKRNPQTGNSEKTNTTLDFIKSHHFVVGYDKSLSTDWRLKIETYYQYLYNVPIEQGNKSTYSLLNDGSDFAFLEKNDLVNDGLGRNFGLELTLEKFFSRNYYTLITTSLFNSEYKGANNVWYQTTYNNQWIINLLGGKEWHIKERETTFTFDTKLTASGGRPYTKILMQESRDNANREVLAETPNTEKLGNYFRWDIKGGYRWNRPKTSHTFYIDFLNITNTNNEYRVRFNEVTGNLVTVNQRGFFIDFKYKIEF